MAYLGTPIDTTNQFQSLQGKRFSGDGSTTAFTLDIAPSSVFDIEVFVENVRQDPNSAYGISGTTLTFTGAPPSGTNNIYVVHQAKAVGTIDVPASGVVPASLASNIISGQTELAATPATTDELLISDAGTIKRIDFSLLGNTPAFHATNTNSQTISLNSDTKVTFDNEVFDDEGVFASSRFTVPSGKAGKYAIFIDGAFQCSAAFNQVWLKIYKNGSQGDQGNQIEQRIRLNGNYFTTDSSIRLSASGTMNLSASDYLEVYGYINADSGTPQFNGGTFNFSGFKLAGA